MNIAEMRVLIAVGSRQDQICSIGSFARAEGKALAKSFRKVEMLEPASSGSYPDCSSVTIPNVIFFHAPALHDRKRPWNALLSAALLRRKFPKARFLVVVHEFSEAPLHWKLRQIALLRMSSGAIVNSEADFEGLKAWHSRILKTSLGPTLFMPELKESNLTSQRASARNEIIRKFASSHGFGSGEKWVLHPGLVTPGKGVNSLGRLAPQLDASSRLLVMGGLGPKARDQEFARQTLAALGERFKNKFSFIEAPDDATFAQLLLASDLVVLPYDEGLSERRSSFLSAMSCGANVWTTTGRFTPALRIDQSGAHAASAERWLAGDAKALESIAEALSEPDEKTVARRTKNLAWAAERSWERRVSSIAAFILSLQ